MKTRLMTSALAAVVVGGLLVAAPATGAETPLPGTPAAAQLPEVAMVCAPGQADLNAAPLSDLMAVLQVSAPIAERVIGFRPYLRPSDILVVEGIGPDRLASILAAGRVCARPTATPPPVENVCVDARVDLQSASSTDIAKKLGVSKNAADNIVSARPFSTLRHVTPERVPGLGKGNLAAVSSKACLTPMPVRTAETTFRWAYRSQTTTVARDGYSLAIPAGVVDSIGAWASITPVPPVQMELPVGNWPKADFHIYGAWEGNGERVFVTMPADPLLAVAGPGWEPYVVHTRADGTMEIDEGLTYNAQLNNVTVPARSLSIRESIIRGIGWPLEKTSQVLLSNRFSAPTCPSGWTAVTNTNQFLAADGARLELTSALLNLPGNTGLFGVFPYKHCVGPDGTSATVRLRNNLGALSAISAASPGASFGAYPSSATVESDLWALLFTTALTAGRSGQVFLAPGDTGWFTIPRESMATVNIQPDRLASLAYQTVSEGMEFLTGDMIVDGLLTGSVRAQLDQWVKCISSVLGTTGGSFGDQAAALPGLAATCINVEAFLTSVRSEVSAKFRAGNMSGDKFNRYSVNIQKVDRFLKWITVGRIVVNANDAIFWGTLDNGLVSAEHYAPRPRFDSQGRTVSEGCIRHNGLYGWRIDEVCQDAFYFYATTPPPGSGSSGTEQWTPGLILRDGHETSWYSYSQGGRRAQVSPITSGNLYLCLARHYAVDWADDESPSHYGGADIFLGPVGCDDSAPSAILNRTTVPANTYILRESSGRSWKLFSDGRRAEIQSQREFMCLTDPDSNSGIIQFFVWDQVPLSVIEASWPDVVPYPTMTNCAGGF